MAREGVNWSQIAVEAIAIVVSILLAFAIDAWWDSRGERATLLRQIDAVRSEIASNRVELGARKQDAMRALLAAQELVRVSSPSPPDLSADSLGTLLEVSFILGAANVTDAALDGFLAASAFDLASEPDLHAALLRLRTSYQSHRDNAQIFAEIRETVIAYLATVMPVGAVSHKTGSHDPTDFPVPVRTVLSDPRFESHIGNLAVRTQFLSEDLDRLMLLTDSVVPLLDRARAF